MQQVFDGLEAFGAQHRRAGGTNAFDVRESCIQLERQIRV